ncbi:MAG: chlorophyll synthase ChlG [Caldilineaceae bacterium]|nr:chlorophyll synthase ChlG [Caldilineaceae bacterium]
MQQTFTTTPPSLDDPTRLKKAQRVTKPTILMRSFMLMKPITWFGPMWALLCGAVASGQSTWQLVDIGRILLGIVLAGPVLCGVSQIINDYFDKDIDAINEPHRLIPAKLVSNGQILASIGLLLLLGVALGAVLGPNVSLFSAIGLVLAISYSAPPVRAKRNGWIGNAMVAISYEGLAWLAGHSIFAELTMGSVLIATLYSIGAHGIMTINDFKSIAGDRTVGIRTIPVIHGEKLAAWLTVMTMNLAQLGVIAAFVYWQQWIIVAIIGLIILLQLPIQRRFIQEPMTRYLKFSAIGVSFFVWGMMVAAVGLRWVY